MSLDPARDTTVTAVGDLAVHVSVRSAALVARVALDVIGGPLQFAPVAPLDTLFVATYRIPLGGLSGSSFALAVRAADILGDSVTTPAVTVRVR